MLDQTYDLICEGWCNPGRPHADELAMRVKHGDTWLSDAMVTAQHALHHTTHLRVSTFKARCTVCQHERKWFT